MDNTKTLMQCDLEAFPTFDDMDDDEKYAAYKVYYMKVLTRSAINEMHRKKAFDQLKKLQPDTEDQEPQTEVVTSETDPNILVQKTSENISDDSPPATKQYEIKNASKRHLLIKIILTDIVTPKAIFKSLINVPPGNSFKINKELEPKAQLYMVSIGVVGTSNKHPTGYVELYCDNLPIHCVKEINNEFDTYEIISYQAFTK